MTVEEFAKLAAAIKTYYPKDNMLPTDETMDLWYDMLQDLDYQSAYIGLKKYVATNKFPPAVSDIISCAADVRTPQELNEMEAWALVSRAIRNSSYNSVEEFAKLPPIVQKTVGLPDQLRTWALDEDYNEEVVSSNFIKCYKTVAAREKEVSKLPRVIRAAIEMANAGSYAAQIEEKRRQMMNPVGIEDKRGSDKEEMKHMSVDAEEKLKRLYAELGSGK